MRVVQLIGPYTGQVLEMPYDAATNCIASGTACLPGKVHLMSIKGLNTDQFDEEALTGKMPTDETAEDEPVAETEDAKPEDVKPEDETTEDETTEDETTEDETTEDETLSKLKSASKRKRKNLNLSAV